MKYQFHMTQHGTYPRPILPYHFLINRIFIIFRCRFFGCIHDLLDKRNIILGKVICDLFSRKRFLHFFACLFDQSFQFTFCKTFLQDLSARPLQDLSVCRYSLISLQHHTCSQSPFLRALRYQYIDYHPLRLPSVSKISLHAQFSLIYSGYPEILYF